jgi:glycosyltransferase involved in cell wall biosynthesis
MSETKKTIAIDIRLLGKKRTGDEMVFFHLTKEILKLDKENQYLLLTDETEAEKIKILSARLECAEQKNAKVISLPSKNRFIWNLWTLPKYLFQNKIDVFHTQYILPLFAPRRAKIITHIHDVSFRAYPELIGWLDRLFLSLFIPRSLRKAALIITPSQFTKDEIIKYYSVSAEKIIVIPNAVGEKFLENTEINQSNRQMLKEKYNLPEKYILYVGTLQPRKNIPFLIEAFAKLQKHLRGSNMDAANIKLVLVGNRAGHHTDKRIDEIITEKNLENDVVFSGFIDQKDLPSVCRLAHIFVFPSLYEGFGIPLLEAMSQRVPIAASDIPSLRETALGAAIYFNPADVANCEDKLYTLSVGQKQREELIQRGKERLISFSWQESAKLLYNVYNSLLKS